MSSFGFFLIVELIVNENRVIEEIVTMLIFEVLLLWSDKSRVFSPRNFHKLK